MNETVCMKPKILLVDDREDNLLSIEAILRQDDYQFSMAYSGTEALKILNKESDFAMILMDVKMPILSGFETASLIYERETLKHIPIIFITANYYGEENLFKGYQSGGIDYIFKPINPEVLRAKVSTFIDLYRKNRLLVQQDEKLLEINKRLTHEIKRLKDSGEKLEEINRNLRKKIADLESIMKACNIPIEKSEFVSSDLNILVQNLLDELHDEVKCATITVDKLPHVRISPRLMRPLFKNLISHTLLFQRENSHPVIRIHSEICGLNDSKNHRDRSKNYCNIFVEADGNAFSDAAPRERYGRYCDTERGLVLYQKILEHHDGSISAESMLNEGSKYIISLPILSNTLEE